MSTKEMLFNLVMLQIGTFFGLLGNILIGTGRLSKRWAIAFYGLSIAVALVTVIYMFIDRDFKIEHLITLFVSLVCIGSTWVLFNSRMSYTTAQLNPKVIKFTEDAKKNVLKLFAGDLNFLGNTPTEMDSNGQYLQLKSMKFDQIEILCEKPEGLTTKARYGKILLDFNNTVTFKHYNQIATDFNIRGRIKKVHPDIDKVLIYEKIHIPDKGSEYRTVETDINNSDCHLYIRLWNLLWKNSDVSLANDHLEWKKVYSEFDR